MANCQRAFAEIIEHSQFFGNGSIRELSTKSAFTFKNARAGHLKFATVPRLPSSPGYDVTCLRQTTAWQASRRAKEDGGQKSRVRGQWTDDRSLTTRGKDGILAESARK